MNIGKALDIDDVTTESFEQAASDVGLGKTLAMKRYNMMLDNFEKSLREAASELADEGFGAAVDMCGKILKKCHL